jgi:hypothetical protein
VNLIQWTALFWQDDGSDEEEAVGEEDEKALSAKTLLSKSMWGPADIAEIQQLEKAGLLRAPEDTKAFSSVHLPAVFFPPPKQT